VILLLKTILRIAGYTYLAVKRQRMAIMEVDKHNNTDELNSFTADKINNKVTGTVVFRE
jgi:hypothetical protein